MPTYMIVRDSATRTPVELTPEEAELRAQTQRVIEMAADGREVGPVEAGHAEAFYARAAVPGEDQQEPAAAPAPAEKKTAAKKKA